MRNNSNSKQNLISFKNLIKSWLILLILHTWNAPAAIIITNIAQGCMANHDLFVKSDGSLWGMGDNSENDLGDGTPNIVPRPEQIVYSNVTAVAVGEYHSLFIKSDGSLWGMGDNEQDQLGIGSWLNATPEEIVSSHVTSIAAGANWSLFIKSDGSLWQWEIII